jgi:hypothetical protein
MNWTEFLFGVLQNIVAIPLVLAIGYFWYRLTKHQKFTFWANNNIIPLWIFYLTLNSRLARIQNSILKIAKIEKNAMSEAKLSSIELWLSQGHLIHREDSIRFALDLSKAELDSECMVEHVSIWVRHVSGIGLPNKISMKVLELEEQVTEFNATFIRHSRILRELLKMLESSQDDKFIVNQRNLYIHYFIGNVDRTVSSVSFKDFKKLGREKWVLGDRLNHIKIAIEQVNKSHGQGMSLPSGSDLWHEEGKTYEEFVPIIS